MRFTVLGRIFVTKVFLIAILLSFILSSSSCLYADQQSNETSEPDIASILQRGVLRVGLYYEDKPPFVMTKEDGSLYGVDIDLAENIGRELGVAVQFDRTSKTYSELIDRVSAGNDFDIVICKMSSTMGRARMVRFTRPYLVFNQGLALNKKFLSENKIKSDYPIASLREKKFKIGARVATSYVEYSTALFPEAEIVEGEWDEIVEKLLKGEIDGLMRDEFTLMTMIKQKPDIALKLNIYRIKDRTDPIAIAVPAKNSMLQYWLDLYLERYLPSPMTSDDLIRNYPELWQK